MASPIIKKEKGVDEYRARFIALVLDQEDELDDLLDTTAEQVKVLAAESETEEGELDIDRFRRYVPYVMGLWSLNFTNLLIQKNQGATRIAIDEASDLVDTLGNAGFVSQVLSRGQGLLSSVPTDLLTRKPFGDGVTLEWRIKTIERAYSKTILDVVRMGADEGWSAFQVASKIDNIVKPKAWKKWVSPYDFYRGVGVASKQRKAGSVSYNSFRIARTELSETYRQQSVKIHEGQPWIRGFEWKLSPAHPDIGCECEDVHGQIFQRVEDMPHTHPNCMCYTVPVLI